MGTRRQTHESPLTEIELGLALMMPPGQRQADLEQAAQAMFDSELQGRSLPFNKATASHCAHTVAIGGRTRVGRPISTEDAHIAAIALAHGIGTWPDAGHVQHGGLCTHQWIDEGELFGHWG